MSHWATQYIGLPFESGARGPDKVDCLGLVRLVFAKLHGVELPELPGLNFELPMASASEMKRNLVKDWIEIPRPVEGCLVAMSQRRSIHHIGVYADVDGGKVIHSWINVGVVADTLRGLRMRGVKVIKFYRHVLDH